MGGEERAEGEEELLKTKNITISVPKTDREIHRGDSWRNLKYLVFSQLDQRRDLILFLDARRRRGRRRGRKEEAVDSAFYLILFIFLPDTENET